jgi:5-(carboxyamino)imidazole ribonucleotide synthase
VGIVGAGQLARMTLEAASALGVEATVLAARRSDAAALVCPRVVHGSPDDADALAELARRCDVLTFDHEQVDPGLLVPLLAGVAVRPEPAALGLSVDKAHCRRTLRDAGIPQPVFSVLDGADPLEQADAFAAGVGWPVVLKAATGGYDGKGVWIVDGRAEAAEVIEHAGALGVTLLVEAYIDIDAELAVQVARTPTGDQVAWPVVRTVQHDGVCREVLVPAGLPAEVTTEAEEIAGRVAHVVGASGVLAVELFWGGGRVTVNEIATRPHNSGHWTIEGASCSQFENHLRGVLGLPLGETTLRAPCVASVNVFGGADGTDPADRLADALSVPGAHVHLYGKAARPGRKLGHVTVLGTDPGAVRALAWEAAGLLGTAAPYGAIAEAT